MNIAASTTLPSKWKDARQEWDKLELLRRGESKEIRIVDDEHVIVRLIPSLYSYTQNRSAMFEGTDTSRLQAFQCLAGFLKRGGIDVATVAFGEDFYITRRLKRDGRDHVPPLEIIVKARHVGTPKHTLYRIEDHRTLQDRYFRPNRPHAPYVRFDYTNPITDDGGRRLRDECIPTQLAAHFIDVAAAEQTAIAAFSCLFAHLSSCGIRLDDICFKMDHTGRVIFGEISPDCMRAVWVGEASDFFGVAGEDTSKDTFRAGSAETIVKERYERFVQMLNRPVRAQISPFTWVSAET